jgi:transcriptional regulator GlxA family with amidase domain
VGHSYAGHVGEPLAFTFSPPFQTRNRNESELRLRKAEVLLATTFLSLKEIAEAIGIVSVTHLMKDFKERHGITPREYRIAAKRRRG